ncbi:flavodoxin family protein [Candidatus Sumerlaeota bacterium]|nr:flavodoxin family protein [Candidatus Sumerlaeota bacterium]
MEAMNAVTILGSPRKDGNTARVLGWVEDELRTGGHGVERITIADHRIEGCRGCYTCQGVEDDPGCAETDDDAGMLFKKLLPSEPILIATPLFVWGYPGQLKLFLDRWFCLVKFHGFSEPISLARGKRIGLLVTAAGERRGNVDLLLPPFREMVNFLMARNAGELVIPRCTTPDALGKDVETRAREFARELVG